MKKFLKVFAGLLLAFVIVFVLTFMKHPIIGKWALSEAWTMGKPIDAIVYTDGHINHDIKVYKDDRYKNDYLLSLKEYDKYGMLQYINIDMNEKWVGRPVGSSSYDYDTINGKLYQSEVGEHFVNFKDDMKGFSFDPQLTFINNEIRFNIPPNELKFDSIRIRIK